MRRLALIIGVLALTLPPVAGALMRGPGDGTLVVDNAQGTIVLRVRGGIIGRFDQGTIDVTDVVDGDGPPPVIRRCEAKDLIGPRRTLCSSETEVRFRLLGGLYRVRIEAIGLDLSVVGRGTAVLDGSLYTDQTGRYALNGGNYQSFPHTRTQLSLGTPLPATLGSK
jgi:hypothetical protein